MLERGRVGDRPLGVGRERRPRQAAGEREHHLAGCGRVGDRRAAELRHALDVVRRSRTKSTVTASGSPGTESVASRRARRDERLEVRPRERPHVEAREHGVRELDEPDPEPVAAGLRRRARRAALRRASRAGATRCSRVAPVRRAISFVPSGPASASSVEDRERPLGRRRRAPSTVDPSSPRALVLHITGCYCGDDGIMSFLLECPHCGPARRERVRVPGRGDRRARAAADPARADRLRLLPRQRRRRRSASGGTTAPAAASGSSPSATRARTRSLRVELPRPGSRRRRLMRLPPQPGERIDRSRELAVHVRRRAGSRLRRRHDRLGALRRRAGGSSRAASSTTGRAGSCCCTGSCAELHDDRRRRRRTSASASSRCATGADVRAQNVLGSLDRDLLAVVDKLGGPFTPVGFYYRTMIRPRRLWPRLREVAAQRSPASAASTSTARRTRRYDAEHRRVDVLVIGGGRSGRAAARAAAAARRARAARRRGTCAVGERAVRACSRPARALGDLRGRARPGRRRRRPLPLPRRADRRRDRRDRAAARLPRQRPRRRHAPRRPSRGSSTTWSLKPGERAVVIGADDARRSPSPASSSAPASTSPRSSTCASASRRDRGRAGAAAARARSRSTGARIDCDLARRLGRPPARVLAARPGRRPGRVRRRRAASSSRPSSRPGSRRSARVAGELGRTCRSPAATYTARTASASSASARTSPTRT